MKLVRELLERDEVGPTVVAPLVLWFKSHQTNVDVRVANLMEIISDIRCPINVVEEEKNSEEQRNIDLKVKFLVKLNCCNFFFNLPYWLVYVLDSIFYCS